MHCLKGSVMALFINLVLNGRLFRWSLANRTRVRIRKICRIRKCIVIYVMFSKTLISVQRLLGRDNSGLYWCRIRQVNILLIFWHKNHQLCYEMFSFDLARFCMLVINMSLSSDELRIVTGEFDLELVQELDISSHKLTEINSLSLSSSLILLDISFNSISDLRPLSVLHSLQILVLNSNSISDLSPLSQLYQIRTLELAGNNLASIAQLLNLGSLYNMTQLVMHDTRNTLSNPVCKEKDYFQQVVHALPMLTSLDRILVSSKMSFVNELCSSSQENLTLSMEEIDINLINRRLAEQEETFKIEKEKVMQSLDRKLKETIPQLFHEPLNT